LIPIASAAAGDSPSPREVDPSFCPPPHVFAADLGLGFLVEDGAANLADLAGAEVLDERERAARVGDVVGDQDARLPEIDEVRHWRQDHGHLEALVDAGVELHVHREGVLDVERVAERARDE
jgi:hypothetical protein